MNRIEEINHDLTVLFKLRAGMSSRQRIKKLNILITLLLTELEKEMS